MIIENSQVANVDLQKAWWECIFLIIIGLFWEICEAIVMISNWTKKFHLHTQQRLWNKQ